MKRLFVFVLTLCVSFFLSVTLVLLLPGQYHLDETKNQVQSQELSWTRSWDSPERPLTHLIFERLQNSLHLQLAGFFLTLIFSFLLSLIAIKWVHLEKFINAGLSIGISAPALFWIPLFVYFFCLKINIFPLRFEPHLLGWVLPLLGLAARPVCMSAQILLAEWKKSEQDSYFLVARSKGLSRFQALYRHGLKNALIPYVTQMGNFLIQALMGSVLVESLFSFPGLGLLFVESLQNRDLPVVLVLTLLFTFLIFCVHAFAEGLQRYLEPRERTAN